MANQIHLLDLPNEVLRNHILLRLKKDDMFWNVGLVCKRLMNLTLDICNVINISFSYLTFSDFQPINDLHANDKDGYMILKAKLRCVLVHKEITQCVKTFRMNNTIREITQHTGIIVNCCGEVLSLSISEESEILNSVSRSCQKLEEIHIFRLDLYTLQIIA